MARLNPGPIPSGHMVHAFVLIDAVPTPDEIDRTRSQARGELVSVYQSNEGIAGHLAANASLGLPPDWEAKFKQPHAAFERAEVQDGRAGRS